MLDKKYRFILFGLMVLAQIFIPAKMIWDSEITISEGQAYNFELRPVDPTDFFRGKYITLNYKANNYKTSEEHAFESNSKVYVEIENDPSGFARIKQLHAINYPPSDAEYFEARISWIETMFIDDEEDGGPEILHLYFPFNRLYMEESKAKPAEDLAREMLRDTSNNVYAKVAIHKGNAILQNVYINETSISDLVEGEQ